MKKLQLWKPRIKALKKKRHKNLNDAIIWELEANYDSSECLF